MGVQAACFDVECDFAIGNVQRLNFELAFGLMQARAELSDQGGARKTRAHGVLCVVDRANHPVELGHAFDAQLRVSINERSPARGLEERFGECRGRQCGVNGRG